MQPAVDGPRFDLARAWREPPAMATGPTMRICATFFFVFGGLLMAICAPFMAGPAVPRAGLVGAGLLTMGVGAGCYRLGDRLPRWCFVLLLVIANLGITVVALGAPRTTSSLALAATFLLPIVAAATLLSLRSALALVLLSLVCRAVVTVKVGAALGDVLMFQGSALGMVGMVAWVARLGDAVEQDPLTGLVNRRGLVRRLEEELARLQREGGQLSLVVLDLDGFKQVNDQAGHVHGDRLIVECVSRWRACLPEDAVLGRYGGDEFVLLLGGVPLGLAADIADEMRAAMPPGATVSAGVAAWQQADSGSMLLNRADVALYEAKATGRDRTVVYGDPDREARELETAIADGEMRVLLQPLVRLCDGETFGFEALLRWHRPGRGVVPPLAFVPRAEGTGAIHALGAWVMEECCRLAMTLPGPRRPIAVNVSVHELLRPEYAAGVQRLLERWEMPGDLLIIEVTESVFEDEDPVLTANLQQLRALGAQVAIDDFGAGYSSLRRIEYLPIDLIKVDGALVCSIRPGQDAAILRAIVTMGRSLGVKVLAEHVESAQQADVLDELGYDLAQGYFYGKPRTPLDAVGVDIPGPR